MTSMTRANQTGTHRSVSDPRNANVLVWINGELIPRDEAKISVFDSGYLVGDGVWEGIRLHNGELMFLDRHLDRLYQGAGAIGLNIGRDRDELTAILREVIDVNNMHTGVHLRLMITRGNKTTPSQDPRLVAGGPNIVVIAEHKVADPALESSGIRLFTSWVRRPPPSTLDPKLNCHSKLHEVIALIHAVEAGADEALMLDVHGNVATCNSTNFFIVVHGEVWTSTGEHCLNGITRGLVLEIAHDLDIASHERAFSLTDVYAADEAFVTGTFGGLTSVISVDGRVIGHATAPDGIPGPVTTRLADRYTELVAGHHQEA